MYSFVSNFVNKFFKSQQKTMLRRRKIMTKKRPISNKLLKEEKKKMDYNYELKVLHFQKQLDRQTTKNDHLHEIMQQLFYPDLKLQQADQVKSKVEQVTSSANGIKEEQFEEMLGMDDITQDLAESSLATEMLAVHEKYQEQFQCHHYMDLLNKIKYYCSNYDNVVDYTRRSWAKMAQKSKLDKKSDPLPDKPPFLFLKRQDIPKYHLWQEMISKIKQKIENHDKLSDVNCYADVLLRMNYIFNQVPYELFQLIFDKNIQQCKMEKDITSKLTVQQISKLMTLIKVKKNAIYNPLIKIQKPSSQSNRTDQMFKFTSRMACQIVKNHEKYPITAFIRIFRSFKSQSRSQYILDEDNFQKAAKILVERINEVYFQEIVNFFYKYSSFIKVPDAQFLQILKFDLYRKVDKEEKHTSILSMMINIKKRKIHPFARKESALQFPLLDGYDLLLKLGKSLSQLLTKPQQQNITPYSILKIIDVYYDNWLEDKSLLELISVEFVKLGSQFSLIDISLCFFKITLLGYKSKALSTFVLKRMTNQYWKEIKKYEEQEKYLLAESGQNLPTSPSINHKVVRLRQAVIISLWSALQVYNSKQTPLHKEISLDELFKIIPKELPICSPLIYELSLFINCQLQPYHMFPQLTYVPARPSDQVYFYHELYNHYEEFDDTEVLMREEADKSQLFFLNYNAQKRMFLRQKWSRINVYKVQNYVQWCLTIRYQPEEGRRQCFFEPQKIMPLKYIKQRNAQLLKTDFGLKYKIVDKTKPIQPAKLYDLQD